jgi:hypothetical protein
MYVLLALILFACNPASLVPGSQDCASLKRGRFSYRSELSSNTYTIDHTDALQIETNNLTKELSRWEITWTGPCQYEAKSMDSLQYADPIVFRVVKNTSTYYIFEAAKAGYDKVLSDTLFKIKFN